MSTSGTCTWTAIANAPWLSITSGGSRTGAGTVQFTAAANSGGSRTGTITAGGQSYTVIQATACSPIVTPEAIAAGQFTLPTVWAAGSVAGGAVVAGARGGLAAAGVIAVADLVEVGTPTQSTVHNIVLLVLASLFAPLPYGPQETDSSSTLEPPSGDHWFGTDATGADVFSRVIDAARTGFRLDDLASDSRQRVAYGATNVRVILDHEHHVDRRRGCHGRACW